MSLGGDVANGITLPKKETVEICEEFQWVRNGSVEKKYEVPFGLVFMYILLLREKIIKERSRVWREKLIK